MTTQISKNLLFNTFGVQDFTSLEEAINDMPPSIVEYHLSNLQNVDDDSYLNKRDIEKTLNFGEYNLYIDYDSNIYLEINLVESNVTDSLW